MIIYIYIKRNFALAEQKERKKEKTHTHIDLQLSSMNNASATKNFTNFTTINVTSCEQQRKNSGFISVKEYKKFSHIIYFIYIYGEREREREIDDELVKQFAKT